MTAAIAAVVVAGCSIVEPPGPVTVTGELHESVELTADRPIAVVPVTVRFTPGTEGADGFGRNQYAFAQLTEADGKAAAGIRIIAMAMSDEPQPRAWLLGPSVPLPVITASELRSSSLCTAPAVCEHPYRLVIAADDAADTTIAWAVKAAISFPPGSDLAKTRVDIERTGDVQVLPEPPEVSDAASGTLTGDSDAPQDRVVRLRYTGPTPSAWPLRAEAIVRASRSDGERTPLTQLDLYSDPGPAGSRIFADYVGPDLSILANSFDGCAPMIPCERFLVLHFYPAPEAIEIDWEVEIRVRDYENTGAALGATVSADELTAAEADAIAKECGMEEVIDLAARQGIIDDAEEARQLAQLAADEWTFEDLGGVDVVDGLCQTLHPTR